VVGNLVTGQSFDFTAYQISLPSWGFWGRGRERRRGLQDKVERENLPYLLLSRSCSEAARRWALGVITITEWLSELLLPC